MICYLCETKIQKGRGGARCDGNDWHSRCWNKAFQAWAFGVGLEKTVALAKRRRRKRRNDV